MYRCRALLLISDVQPALAVHLVLIMEDSNLPFDLGPPAANADEEAFQPQAQVDVV